MDGERPRPAEELVAWRRKVYGHIADNDRLLHHAIGEAACELLRHAESISVADLIAHFEGKIAETLSMKHDTDPGFDPGRILFEGAIRVLREPPGP